jgi:hypothetical protein
MRAGAYGAAGGAVALGTSAVRGEGATGPVGVTFEAYGAKGDGATDDTIAIHRAVDDVAGTPDRTVHATPGKTYLVSSVALPAGQDVTLVLTGATIRTAEAGAFAFRQAGARRQLRVLGGRFTGVGGGVEYHLPPSTDQSYDVQITGARFDLPPSQTAIRLVGVREALINECYFENCTGLHLRQSVNTHVTACQFKNCANGIHADGRATGSPFDAGLMVAGVTMIGCGFGVNAVCWDYVSVANSMIDYCDRTVYVVNCTGLDLIGSYLANRNYGGASSPVVEVVSDGDLPQGGYAQHVKILGNQIIAHATIGVVTAVQLQGVVWATVRDNSIGFWRSYGIRLLSSADAVMIVGNVLNGVGSPVASIATLANATRSLISENVSDTLITGVGAGTKVLNNFIP